MLKFKRLYIFIIQSFLPVFLMTFGICLFIVLMQFLWKYVEDLVGKGLDTIVLAELFFYAGLNLIPMALPLAILLASLMTFGSLGEQLELLAIKAAGVSLLRAMKPLIIFIALVAVGAFFFQNEAMPRINVKFSSLLISIKQKSPELDIPEGAFYSGIKGYNIYVKKKNPISKILDDVMIYDTSNGFDNMSVFVCDSAQMRISANKKFLYLNLYHGQRFANFNQAGTGLTSSNPSTAPGNNGFVPYSRENFKEKKIIIPFDAGFNRMDESNLEGTQIAKNITQLNRSIDSMSTILDSLNIQDRLIMTKHTYMSYRSNKGYIQDNQQAQKVSATPQKINFDSLMQSLSQDDMIQAYNVAIADADNNNATYSFQSMSKIDLQSRIRSHEIEWHRKFTLSFACLIFFFIGAPLGAIIRKGGLGMPVVVSVLLFIVYYIINNVGYKLARDGVWDVWQGIWLSSFMLFPLGVFLTYKAMNDSTLFNVEAYAKFIRKIVCIENLKEIEREIAVDISSVPQLSSLNITDTELLDNLQSLEQDRLKDIALNYQKYGYDTSILQPVLSILKERGASFFDIRIKSLDHTASKQALASFIKSGTIAAALYAVVVLLIVIMMTYNVSDIFSWISTLVILLYLGFFTRSYIYYTDLCHNMDIKLSKLRIRVLNMSFLFLGVYFFLLKKRTQKQFKNITWT